MNWRIKMNDKLVSKAEAKFIIAGVEKDRYFELIAFAKDEFTAYLIRKAVIDDGGSANVVPFSEENLKEIEDKIEIEFHKTI